MFKLLGKLLWALRQLVIVTGQKVMSLISDPKTGKIKYFDNPKDIVKVASIGAVVVFISIVIYKLFFTSTVQTIDGIKDYQDELNNKIGVNSQEISFPNSVGDPLASMRKGLTGGENQKIPDLVNSEDKLVPDVSICTKLLDKLKGGAILGPSERVDLRHCLENNTARLSPEELTVSKMIAEDGLSKADQAKINELFATDKSCQVEMNNQLATSEGNAFITKTVDDAELNQALSDLLKDPVTLRNLIAQGSALKTQLNLTADEEQVLRSLIAKCNPSTLLKMLTDKESKDAMRALAKIAAENPEALKNINGAATKEEKDVLRRFANGTPSPEDEAIAKALTGADANKKNLAKDLIKAQAVGDSVLASALMKKLNGEELTPEEQAALAKFDRNALDKAYDAAQAGTEDLKAAYLKQAKGETLGKAESDLIKNKDGLGISSTDKMDLAKALNQDLVNREGDIQDLNAELARAQAEAKNAALKLSRGEVLTPAEQASLQKFAELQAKIAQLNAIQKERQLQLARLVADLQTGLDQIGMTQKTIFPSGIEVIGFGYPKCTDIKPLKIVRKKVPSKTKTVLADIYLDDKGNQLTPDQIKIVQAFRKSKADKLAQFQSDKNSILNPLLAGNDSFVGNTALLNSQSAAGGKSGGSNVNTLFLYDPSEKVQAFKLSPSQLIAAMLMTEILVSDKGQSQTVRVKILQDVYEPSTGKLAIPRNSIALGKTSNNFDSETGQMNLELTSVIVGGKTYDLGFSVNSADNTSGLKGEIRDTRGKILLATLVSSFSAGALSAISQSVISPYTDSTILSETVTGAGLQGAAEVAQKIAQMYAGDLQNAAKIFYAPRGIKVILVPN